MEYPPMSVAAWMAVLRVTY